MYFPLLICCFSGHIIQNGNGKSFSISLRVFDIIPKNFETVLATAVVVGQQKTVSFQFEGLSVFF